MWAVGVYDLGLTDQQFWRLTLREFNALCKRERFAAKEREYHAALVTCMIYNVNRKRGKQALQPRDFMASEKKQRKITDWKQMQTMLKSITVACGGKIK